MNISTTWLNMYLGRTMSTEQLADALAAAGVEIEQIIVSTPLDRNVIIGHIKKFVQHPNADRLRVATVEVGATDTLQIVCGAPNLEIDQKVAVAQVGATLPDGTILKAAELRGVTSQGMLCSRRELALGADHDGILVLEADAPIGQPVASVLPGGDIIDIKTAANRFDLLGSYGLAAEAAAQSGVKLKPLELADLGSSGEEAPKGVVAVAELVPRFMLAHLKIDPNQQSTMETKQLLTEMGLRSISLAVDVTNYVMLELAQPLHAFDAAKVTLPIIVRLAKDGEELVTLDGKSRKLTKHDLVITDAKGVIGLAGVMGGEATAISDTTTEIILEAAVFDAATVRKTAQRHGLRTDASARFERRLPVESPERGLRRAIQLFEQAGGATVEGPITDVLNRPAVAQRLTVSAERIGAFLALELAPKQIAAELEKLNFGVEVGERNELIIDVPWWRPDIKIEEDIAEEVVKLIGYDQVPTHLPTWRPTTVHFDHWTPMLWRLRAELKAAGLFEIATYSFISPTDLERLGQEAGDFLKLKNPLSVEQTYMRQSLLPSFLAVASRNQAYAKEFGIYEVSKVFIPAPETGKQPAEPTRLAVGFRSDNDGYTGVKRVLDRLSSEFGVLVEIKPGTNPLYHPARFADVTYGKQVFGVIGEVHPDITEAYKLDGKFGYLELDVAALLDAVQDKKFQATSKYPAVRRDVSLVLGRDTTWQALEAEILTQSVGEPVFLNDYYGAQLGDGMKSVAFALNLSDPTRTLTDTEADKRVAELVQHLKKTLGAELRS